MANLEDSNLELNDLIILSQTQRVVELGDLLSLPRLPTRRKHGKEPIMDYSNSHVVPSNQYLVLLKQKALENKIVDKIREQKGKNKEKRSKWVEHTLTAIEKTTQKIVEKKIELGSTMHGLLQQLELLANNSTTILW